MIPGACTDLDNPLPPGGAAEASVSPKLFVGWMRDCGYDDADLANPGQVVVKLYEGEKVKIDNIEYIPNWHITAMTDRGKTIVKNFHFKIEASKACSHYWHYVLHRNDTKGTWHWVGDPNPKIAGRNDAGGGAGADMRLLLENLTKVDVMARGGTDPLQNKVTKKTLASMIYRLQQNCANNKYKFTGVVWDVC